MKFLGKLWQLQNFVAAAPVKEVFYSKWQRLYNCSDDIGIL